MNSLLRILSRDRTPASPIALRSGMQAAPLAQPRLPMELGPANIERVAEILAGHFLGAERGLPAVHLLTHIVRGLSGICRKAIRLAFARMRDNNKPVPL